MKKAAKVRLYGFKSCDTVRNAMKWLDANGVAYEFFDYRREKLSPTVVDDWFARAGWETVFNSRYRKCIIDWIQSRHLGTGD